MATGKYNSLGRAMTGAGEWRFGNGFDTIGANGQRYRSPVVCLMGWTNGYPNSGEGYEFRSTHNAIAYLFLSNPTPPANEIGTYVVGYAGLANPRIENNILKGDNTVVNNVQSGHSIDGSNTITQIVGVMIAIDLLEEDGSRYVRRPVFWFDAAEDTLGLGLPRTIPSGTSSITVTFHNSEILRL